MKQPKLFKFVCKCGQSAEVVGEQTEVRCKCKKLMIRADSLHPMTLYRYLNHLGQAALSKLLGVDRSVISKIEAYRFVISDKLRGKIGEITGQDIGHILNSRKRLRET